MTRNKPSLAEFGTYLHQEAIKQFRDQCFDDGAVELIRKSDFIKFRDDGFSICKAIRDSEGKALKVFDEANKRYMISIPDFVDYRNDIIIDLKTIYFQSPPEPNGIFVTECSNPVVPPDYEDATELFGTDNEAKCSKRYEAQLERYKLAYSSATGRSATLHVYVVPFAKVEP